MSEHEIPARQEGESEAAYRERLSALAVEQANLARQHAERANQLLATMGGSENIWLAYVGYPYAHKVDDRGPFLLGFATSQAEADNFCKSQADGWNKSGGYEFHIETTQHGGYTVYSGKKGNRRNDAEYHYREVQRVGKGKPISPWRLH